MSPETRMGLVLAFVAAAGGAALVVTPWVTSEEPRVDLFAHTLASVDLHGVWMDQPYGSVAFVVGDHGTILHGSMMANRWSIEPSGTDVALRGVAATGASGAEIAVAVGDHGTIVRREASGAWTREESGTNEDLLGVATTGGFWYAVGKGGVVLRRDSSARRVWDPMPSGTKVALHAVATAPVSWQGTDDLLAFAVGDGGALLELRSGQPYVVRSASWRLVPSGTKDDLLAGTYAPSGAVAVGRHGAVLFRAPEGHARAPQPWKVERSGTDADLEAVGLEEIAWPKKHRDTPRSETMHASFVAVGHGGVTVARKTDLDAGWAAAPGPLGGEGPGAEPRDTRDARDWSGAPPVLVGARGVALLPTTSKPEIAKDRPFPAPLAPPLPLPFSGIDD